MEIGGIQVGAAYKTDTAGANKGWIIEYNSATSKVTINPAASQGDATAYPSSN